MTWFSPAWILLALGYGIFSFFLWFLEPQCCFQEPVFTHWLLQKKIPWQLVHPFSSVQWLSHVQLPETPWTAACLASLSITNSWSLLKLMSIKSVMPSRHLILCRPPLLPPSIFPRIGVFLNELVLHIKWSKYWSFSFNISPSNEYSGLISFRMDWLDLLAVQETLKSLL